MHRSRDGTSSTEILVGDTAPYLRTETVSLTDRSANAVARVENLEFLTDVVPKTMTFKQAKQKMTKELSGGTSNGVAGGKGTIDSHMAAASVTNGALDIMDMVDDNPDQEMK